MKSGPIVIALGGNAISPEDEIDTIENQFAHTGASAERIVDLIETGWEQVVVTHGNGPQVGNVVLRVEHSRDIAPWLPLDICVADTEGGMGYMIQQCLRNALVGRGIEMPVATIVTQVEVDSDDPAFQNPTKPIGPHRRLVPSPEPKRVIESDVIERMVSSGVLVVAGGGGGVPVINSPAGLKGAEGVVDKDLTAALIASSIKAAQLVMLTDVEGIYTDFGSSYARMLREVSPVELRRLQSEDQFSPGSMGPKVEAACRFVEGGGEQAVVASLDDLKLAVEGSRGTVVRGS